MRNFFRQPLTHFLLAGALIFLFYALAGSPEQEDLDPGLIKVNREALLNFMQYRARAFEPEIFSAMFDEMTQEEVQGLVAEYAREEALYREAMALGLDEGDYIIRQRLIQKVDFLLDTLATPNLDPDEDQLLAFYEARLSDYQIDAVYTFTHIFFDSSKHGKDQERENSMRLREQLADSPIAFTEAGRHGDRYPFLQNYIDRTRDYVVDNFSGDFVDELDLLSPSGNDWAGPIESRYGYHLVLLTKKSEPTTPELEQIRDRVLDDYAYEMRLQVKKEAEDRLVSTYEVSVSL